MGYVSDVSARYLKLLQYLHNSAVILITTQYRVTYTITYKLKEGNDATMSFFRDTVYVFNYAISILAYPESKTIGHNNPTPL
jgi:hypothetical protein